MGTAPCSQRLPLSIVHNQTEIMAILQSKIIQVMRTTSTPLSLMRLDYMKHVEMFVCIVLIRSASIKPDIGIPSIEKVDFVHRFPCQHLIKQYSFIISDGSRSLPIAVGCHLAQPQ